MGRLVKERGDAAYPRLARDRRWEGTSHVRVEFMPGGKVKSIVVNTSSGYAVLDQRALEMVKEVMPKVPDELRDRRILGALPDRVQAGGKALAGERMEDLYPPIEPAQSGWLEVGEGHRLYFEVCGNQQGAPVLFLHGGPGSRTNPGHRRFFDPCSIASSCSISAAAAARRLAGRPAPTPPRTLLADIERLRQHLGVERWLVFGGSCRSTLALAYAQAHPQRVRGLVLRGVFLATDAEVAWYLEGLRHFLPEAWEALARGVPQASCAGLIAHYHEAAARADMSAAHAGTRTRMRRWRWARRDRARPRAGAELLARVRVQLHYLATRCFLEPGQLMRDSAPHRAAARHPGAGPPRSGLPAGHGVHSRASVASARACGWWKRAATRPCTRRCARRWCGPPQDFKAVLRPPS